MPTITVIKEATEALLERNGSSLPALNKWIESEKHVSCIYNLENKIMFFFKIAPSGLNWKQYHFASKERFTKGTETGALMQVKHSFKLLP